MKAGVIVAAVVALGVAAVVFVSQKQAQQAPTAAAPVVAAPELKTVNILVAAQVIPVGTKVTQEMLMPQPWPENLALADFVRADNAEKSVVGFVTRSSFQQGEPIIQSKLANPSDPNFLAGELPKGMRVITIMTNETDGVAGFVFPGDRVDVIVTHDVIVKHKENDLTTGMPVEKETNHPFTEAVVTNVKVVAVDQRSSSAKSTDDQGRPLVPRSVSLMVSPTDAQRIRLGQKMGTLTLALRSLEDKDSSDPLLVTGENDVSQVMGKPAIESGVDGAGSAIKIYRGPEADDMKTPFSSMMDSIMKSAADAQAEAAAKNNPTPTM